MKAATNTIVMTNAISTELIRRSPAEGIAAAAGRVAEPEYRAIRFARYGKCGVRLKSCSGWLNADALGDWLAGRHEQRCR
jgi:hypothetical protein